MSRSFAPLPDDPDGPLDRVEELLGECLAQPEPQWEAAVEETCRANPDHADTVRRRFAALRSAGLGPSGADRAEDLRVVRDLAARVPEVAAALAEAFAVDPASLREPGAPADPRLGLTLADRYHLEQRLGAGAMGVVYRAHDRELRRAVAVKLLDPALFADPRAEVRFAQEAELLASLRHESVVAVYDRGRSDRGEPFVVMELIDGVPLTRALTALAEGHGAPAQLATALGAHLTEPSYVRQVARWGAELAEGLAAAHARGILHRDVKPSNVFVRDDGRAVLLDFGIATRGGDLTAAGTVLGTPWYMAPEQADARAKRTAALDVYGLASCLYHLLCGKPPFDGEPLAVLARLQREDPPRLSAQRPDLPRDLTAIVEVGMARAPTDRYADGAALAADLRAFLAHAPVRARPLGRIGRFWRQIKRHPARAGLVATALLGTGLAVALAAANARESARNAAARKTTLWASLPGELAFEGDPQQRLLAVVRPEHDAHVAELDEILTVDPRDLATRLWRAALHLDAGRHDAASRDLDELQRQAESPYLRAVAERYARANRAAAGTQAIDLTDLGVDPSTPTDCFVAGFHELRNRQVKGFAERAFTLLERARESYLPARDLHLLAMLVRADYEADQKVRRGLFERAIEESLRLEGLYGRPTARTLAVRGTALVALERPRDALDPLQRALELRPDRHGPLQNLAVAWRDLGDLEQAALYLERAHRVRPHFWNTGYLRAQILLDKGDFAAARGVAEGLSAEPTAGPGAEWKRPYLLANIGLGELFAICADGAKIDGNARALRDQLAAGIVDQLDAAGRAGAAAPALEARRALAKALAADDRDTASGILLDQLVRGREDALAMRNLTLLWPKAELSPRLAAYVRVLLALTAKRRAPQDRRSQAALDAAIAHLQGIISPPAKDSPR
jgi:tetratricopeptide (TPR) repeat protein